MLLSKMHGNKQHQLFHQLYGMYKRGVAILLDCPLIRSFLIDALCNPRQIVNTNQRSLTSETAFVIYLFQEMGVNDALPKPDLHAYMVALLTAEQLIYSPLSQYQKVMFLLLFCITCQMKLVSTNKCMLLTESLVSCLD